MIVSHLQNPLLWDKQTTVKPHKTLNYVGDISQRTRERNGQSQEMASENQFNFLNLWDEINCSENSNEINEEERDGLLGEPLLAGPVQGANSHPVSGKC